MLTAEIVSEAFATSHSECKGKACLHAQAIGFNGEEVEKLVVIAAVSSDPLFSMFVSAFHVGYRAAVLEARAATGSATKKTEVA